MLQQLQLLPAAIQAGNGEGAWHSIQKNGLSELQAEWEKRARAKAEAASVAETAGPVQAAAAQTRPPTKPSGLDGLKGIFAGTGSKSTVQSKGDSTWAEKMAKAQADADADEAAARLR